MSEEYLSDDGINGHVYKTTNLITGQIYIGAKSKSLYDTPPFYLGVGKLIKEAVKEYGFENFKKEILSENITDLDELNDLEEAHISIEKSGVEYGNYNIQKNGGPIVIGAGNNKESAKIVGKKLRGRVRTDEHKQNISLSLLKSKKFQDWIRSDKHRERMSKVHKGKKKSLTQCHKLSYTNGHCVALIPPKDHWIKEIIFDNSVHGVCVWLGLSYDMMIMNYNKEIRPYHISITPAENQILSIGWLLYDSTKSIEIDKCQTYTLHKFISPSGEVFETYKLSKFCIERNWDIRKIRELEGMIITDLNLGNRIKNRTYIGWKYESIFIDESEV